MTDAPNHSDDTTPHPFAQDRERADRLLREGETEIPYLGATIYIHDHESGWFYYCDGESFSNMEEAFDAVERKLEL